MGKEKQGRQLEREAQRGKAASTSAKRLREKGLSTERSQDARKDEGEERRNEERLEKSIDELLVECHRKASEDMKKVGPYEPGEELEDRKRLKSSLGWAREAEEPSHSEWRKKQSVGIGHGQRRSSEDEVFEESTGELSRHSQFACDVTPRLALTPCRGEEQKTEHGQWSQCRKILQSLCAKKEVSLKDVGPALSQSLEVLSQTTRCGQSTEGVFPLPLPEVLEECSNACPTLELVVRGLNSLYGVETTGLKKVNRVQRRILERLRGVVEASEIPRVVLPPVCLDQFFATKGIDYSGEEVRVARAFEWKMIAAAFPEGVGSLELGDFCEGGTLSYVAEFEKFLLPPQDQHLGKTPAVMVSQTNWAEVCLGLVKRGVCGLMKREQLYHVGDKPVLNGLFAVEKGEKALDAKGEEFEVCRLIMNLVPTNGLCRNLVGDTSTLPTVTGMAGTVLDDGELLLTSSEDVRCFFYLFRTPVEWHRFMGFASVAYGVYKLCGNCSACTPQSHSTSVGWREAVGRQTTGDSPRSTPEHCPSPVPCVP